MAYKQVHLFQIILNCMQWYILMSYMDHHQQPEIQQESPTRTHVHTRPLSVTFEPLAAKKRGWGSSPPWLRLVAFY